MNGLPLDIVPLMLALTAGFLFALGSQIQNLGFSDVDSRTGATISITASALFFWVMAPFFMVWDYWLNSAILIFVLIGLFRPALSASMAVAGMRYLGPTLASTLSSTSPLFGAAMGVLWLNESFTLPTAIGTVGIVGAVILLSRKNKSGGIATDWPTWALLLPIGAACLRSLGHVLSKIGMEDIPDPYFAGMVGFTVSAILLNGVRRIRKTALPPIPWHTKGPRWFALAGMCFGTAIIALNAALLRGDVVMVVPIVAASPIFTMVLGAVLFKKEVLNRRVVIAVLIVVPSVIVIALG